MTRQMPWSHHPHVRSGSDLTVGERAADRSGPTMRWERHPGVRSGRDLTLGERAADVLRSAMGSWAFIFAALGFLAAWIGLVQLGVSIDNKQLTILNLVLSCLAALQGGILLIAAKRADTIASELANHDYGTNQEALALVRAIAEHLQIEQK